MTSQSLPPGTLLAGKFRIERLLGVGAMGAVYAIHHEVTQHKRALKLLHPSARSEPEVVERFLNEASAAGRAGNPHLVETFDGGTLPSGEPYVVMELLEGETLGALLAREHTLQVTAAAEIVAQAAEGMAAAHRAGIVHRDLKPDNIFITQIAGRPFVKILDFGISKFSTLSGAQAIRTRTGAILGSPAYMAPEQLEVAKVDERTDVFALGVVLYESLTGARPFDAPTIGALMVRLVQDDATPIESLRSDLPPALVELIRHALARSRDERLASVRALAESLAPFRPIVVTAPANDLGTASTVSSLPPPSPLPQIPRLGAPRVPGMLAIGAAGLALLGASAWALRSSHRQASSVPSAMGLHDPTPPPSLIATGTPRPSPLLVTAAIPATSQSMPSGAGARPVASPPGPTSRPSAAHGAGSAATAAAPSDLGLHRDNPFHDR